VPVNEMIRDKGREEKHWWLALLLNPRGGSRLQGGEHITLLSLDSFARTEWMCDPPLRTLKSGKLESYPAEVNGLSRQGLFAQVRFRAQGDGSRGALVDPRKSKLFGGGSELRVQKLDMTKDERGDDGKPGIVEGTLEFHLDSRVSTNGEYLLEYGGLGAYRPKLRLNMQRKATTFQRQVSKFLGGYLAKEWETAADRPGGEAEAFEMERIENGLQLPEVPQQEREMILGSSCSNKSCKFCSLHRRHFEHWRRLLLKRLLSCHGLLKDR